MSWRNDEPRDLTLFQPFLRPVGGEDRAWADTVWLTQMLNELRAGAGEVPAQHKNVLAAVRGVMENLENKDRLNFQPIFYLDAYSRQQPAFQFSDAVVFPVIGAVGGKVADRLLYRANVEFNRLKRAERSGGGDGLVAEVLREMREDRRHAEQRHQDLMQALIVRAGSLPAQPDNVVLFGPDPALYGEPLKGLPRIRAGRGPEHEAETLARLMGVSGGAGGFTAYRLKKFLGDRRYCQFEDGPIEGANGAIPRPMTPEYRSWFAWRWVFKGTSGRWAWCFTDVGVTALEQRVPEIKRWFLTERGGGQAALDL